jgi:hypothetical protein
MRAETTQPGATTNGDDKNMVGVEEEGESGLGLDDRHQPVSPRTKEFGFLPIPKSKRHDPTLKTHEQFAFTWKMNLILAGAAVSGKPRSSLSVRGADCQTVSVSNLYYSQVSVNVTQHFVSADIDL